MQPLRSVLGKFVKDIGLESGAVLRVLRRRWIAIVGKTIALHTFPDIMRNRVLTIIVDTPQWMHHISFFKGELSEKLASYGVEGIRFRIGRLPGNVEDSHSEKDRELTDEDRRFLENTVRSVQDEELKEKFTRLISRGLTKGRKIKR